MRRFEDLTLGELDLLLAGMPDADVWIRCRAGEGCSIVLRIKDQVIDTKTGLSDALARIQQKGTKP